MFIALEIECSSILGHCANLIELMNDCHNINCRTAGAHSRKTLNSSVNSAALDMQLNSAPGTSK